MFSHPLNIPPLRNFGCLQKFSIRLIPIFTAFTGNFCRRLPILRRCAGELARNLLLFYFSETNLHRLQKITTLRKERCTMLRIANETTTATGCQWAEWTDEELLMEYRYTGIRETFEEIVHRYERELYHYLYRYLGNAANAEDVFQKTFLAVLRDCDKFDAGREFRPWLYSIATHKAIDYQRQTRRFRVISQVESDTEQGMADQVAGTEPEPFADSMDKEIAGKVREAVEQLPTQLRQAVYMVYFQGLTYREAAAVVGIHCTTLSLRLKSAIGKLNFLLKSVG